MRGIRAGLLLLPCLLVACSVQPESAPTTETPPPAATEDHATMPEMAKAPTTPDEMIASAMSAAPEAVAKDATIITVDDKMQVQTLRAGTNGWTCVPDQASSPGPDPMCVDANGMGWMMAWMEHKDPPAGKMAFAYMLMGGSDASNDDPFATTPKPGDEWLTTGPHVMVLNIGDRFDGYPTAPGDAKTPYVMYPNTPYAHLMIPVK